jgi:hypothetical protein
MAECTLCHVLPADRQVECQGYVLPYCGKECASLMHKLIGVNGDGKRKPEDPEDDDDDNSNSKRARPNALTELTNLLVARMQEAARRGQVEDVDAAIARLRQAQQDLEQQRPTPMETTLPSHVLHAPNDSWFVLPVEVRLVILSGLSIMDLMRMRATSPYVQRQVDQEPLWRHFCTRGPIARVFGTPPQLYMRTWLEQGMTLLRAHSYVVWRPHDPIRPVAWIPSAAERAANRPVVEIHYDADMPLSNVSATEGLRMERLANQRITRVLIDRVCFLNIVQRKYQWQADLNNHTAGVLLRLGDAEPVSGYFFDKVPVDGRAAGVFVPDWAHRDNSIISQNAGELTPMTVLSIGSSFASIKGRGADIRVHLVRVYQNGVVPKMLSLPHDHNDGLPGYQEHLRIIQFSVKYDSNKSEEVLKVSHGKEHTVRALRFVWRAPPAATIRALLEAGKLLKRDWLDGSTETLRTIQWHVGDSLDDTDDKPAVPRPGTYALEVVYGLVYDITADAEWELHWCEDPLARRLVPLVPQQEVPIPATDQIVEPLYLIDYAVHLPSEEEDAYARPNMANVSDADLARTRAYLAQVKQLDLVHDEILEDEPDEGERQRAYRTWFSSYIHEPIQSHHNKGVAVLYKPSFRMAMVPMVLTNPNRAVRLTKGVEGIAARAPQ